ncbi:MAG TPA: non-heme iron oxygenase ferredoxin subunit [Acidimicrobiales bacterium]|nr:non-heme iron oxygenase ferredoxin subunit [Acidimicrobiales bacterium]
MSEPGFVDLCSADEIKLGEARRFMLEIGPVCLVRCNDGFKAIFDVCSHEDFALSEGEVELDECLIECWKHGSMFSLNTGQPVSFPATQPVPVYEVVIEDGRVLVKVS